MGSEEVIVEAARSTLVVTINRPEVLNAVNQAVWDGLGDALEQADRDPGVRAVIITGAGERAFCAGADLTAIANHEFRRDPDPVRDAWGFAGVVTHPVSKPVIAAVNGLALGGGWEIVLSCDLVVAADTAQFGLPEVRHGLIAGGGGALRLPRHLPPALAMEVLLTGATLDARRAAELGLVNAVVPHEEVLMKALELAELIARNAPLAVQATKRIASAVVRGQTEDEGWRVSDRELAAVLVSEDAAEGPRAFAEKRQPVWRAR